MNPIDGSRTSHRDGACPDRLDCQRHRSPRLDVGSRAAGHGSATNTQQTYRRSTNTSKPVSRDQAGRSATVSNGIFWDNWSAKVEYDFYDFGISHLKLPGTISGVPEVVPGIVHQREDFGRQIWRQLPLLSCLQRSAARPPRNQLQPAEPRGAYQVPRRLPLFDHEGVGCH